MVAKMQFVFIITALLFISSVPTTNSTFSYVFPSKLWSKQQRDEHPVWFVVPHTGLDVIQNLKQQQSNLDSFQVNQNSSTMSEQQQSLSINQNQNQNSPTIQSQSQNLPTMQNQYQYLPTMQNQHLPTVQNQNQNSATIQSQNQNLPVIQNQHQNLPVIQNQHQNLPIIQNQHQNLPIIQHQNLPVIQSQNQNLPVIQNQHQNLPIIQHQNLPVIQSQNQNLPVIQNQHQNLPIIQHQHQNLPTIQSQNQNLPITQSQNQNTPIIQSQNQNLPPIQNQNQNIPIIQTQNQNIPTFPNYYQYLPVIPNSHQLTLVNPFQTNPIPNGVLIQPTTMQQNPIQEPPKTQPLFNPFAQNAHIPFIPNPQSQKPLSAYPLYIYPGPWHFPLSQIVNKPSETIHHTVEGNDGFAGLPGKIKAHLTLNYVPPNSTEVIELRTEKPKLSFGTQNITAVTLKGPIVEIGDVVTDKSPEFGEDLETVIVEDEKPIDKKTMNWLIHQH